MDRQNISQHYKKLFGSLINKDNSTHRNTKYCLITLQYNGTNLSFSAHDEFKSDSNLNKCDEFVDIGDFKKFFFES
ncbi:MAG TPA: hypothetical protein VJ767_02795 [Nitrososphaeraceae archaeon]|nr:hypothetical protein [Nitrososphaeraceae archaeon]